MSQQTQKADALQHHVNMATRVACELNASQPKVLWLVGHPSDVAAGVMPANLVLCQ